VACHSGTARDCSSTPVGTEAVGTEAVGTEAGQGAGSTRRHQRDRAAQRFAASRRRHGRSAASSGRSTVLRLHSATL
jgi:hypothetical protein